MAKLVTDDLISRKKKSLCRNIDESNKLAIIMKLDLMTREIDPGKGSILACR
jgi:hypothetical protein